jgi:hypothetical protein
MPPLVIWGRRNWSVPVADTDTAGRWPTSGLSGRRHEVSAQTGPW